MGKGTIIVGVSSLIIIVLFSIMTFLTATIEPPQLSPAKSLKSGKFLEDATIPVATPESSSEGKRQSEGIIFDDAGILPIVDTAQYGIDKMDIDVIDFYRSTTEPPHMYPNKDRKVVPPLWPRHEIIVNPTMHKVMPPLWPTTSIIIDTGVSRTNKVENSKTNSNNNAKQLETNNSSIKVDKPMKRRSVNNYILDEDSSSVILKILDYNGKPRIEIKLWSDYLSQTMKEKSKEATDENLSRFNMESDNNNTDHKNDESEKNTIITIMANDSIVVEESGSKNITELLDSIVFISKSDKNNKINNNTEYVSEFPIDNPLYEYKLSEMLVNSSQSSDYRTNSSNSEINNNTDTETMKQGTISNNKISKKSSSDTVNGNSPHNDKISISDIYPNNYTDLFIESDNDMVY